jgi:hypothetical protein
MAAKGTTVITPESDIFSVSCSSVSLDSPAFYIIPDYIELCAPMPSGEDDFCSIVETPSYAEVDYPTEDSFEYNDDEATPSADVINVAHAESLSSHSMEDIDTDYEWTFFASPPSLLTSPSPVNIDTSTESTTVSTTVEDIPVPIVIDASTVTAPDTPNHNCSIDDLSRSLCKGLLAAEPKCQLKYGSDTLLHWYKPVRGDKTYVKITFWNGIYCIYLWTDDEDGECARKVIYGMARNYRRCDKNPGKKLSKSALAFSRASN